MNCRKKKILLIIISLTITILAGCSTTNPEKTDSEKADPENIKAILYDEWPVGGFSSDAADITQVSVEENNLTIDVTYQGGCQKHDFNLYAWSAFLESLPPQGTLYLSHNAHGDSCTDEISQSLSFDLSPLDQERNDPSEHPLLLRIFAPIGGSFSTDPIMPLIEWP